MRVNVRCVWLRSCAAVFGPLLCFDTLCFCVLASPAGRVFCVFVFWPCSPECCVLCFRVLGPPAGSDG